MRYAYVNMDVPEICATEEELIDRVAYEGCQLSMVPNLLGTETIVAAGAPPFTNKEILATYRILTTGGHLGRESH
jgi:hypothetical protein